MESGGGIMDSMALIADMKNLIEETLAGKVTLDKCVSGLSKRLVALRQQLEIRGGTDISAQGMANYMAPASDEIEDPDVEFD